MKVGLIARADDRGLGNLTWEFARHMQVERTLLVDVLPRKWPIFPERYENVTLVSSRPELNEIVVREWLYGLDVVYSAETFYDWRLCDWARSLGVRTVCHAMPEFYRHGDGSLPAPDVWWVPTCWWSDRMPEGTRLVPVPVPLDRWPSPDLEVGERVRYLHVGGRRALADRNGLNIVTEALRALRVPARVTLTSQDRMPSLRTSNVVDLTRRVRTLAHYPALYEQSDVLVMPRRFGGLSLPVLEALGAGLMVMMTDCEPQSSTWPIVPLPWSHGVRTAETPGGAADLCNVRPAALASAMDDWSAKPEKVAERRLDARLWAYQHSWSEMRWQIEFELERACG